jgi:prepilin-type N-terminal cleavage/methylation domain-containing protein
MLSKSHIPNFRASRFAGSRRAGGFSLVELMVAMAAGLIVLGATLAFVISSVQSNAQTMRVTRLMQELRVVSTLVANEVRRAGFDRDAVTRVGTNFFGSPWTLVMIDGDQDATEGTCLVIGYDRPNGGRPWKAFRLDNATAQFWQGDAAPDGCPDADWEDLTNPAAVRITRMQFSRCPFLDEDDECSPIEPVPGIQVAVRGLTIELEAALAADPDTVRFSRTFIRMRSDELALVDEEEEGEG